MLKKLGIPTKFAGLHIFKHGLTTEFADKSSPIPVLQKQMRHADIRTTLRSQISWRERVEVELAVPIENT